MAGVNNSFPSWSPDGRKIVFVSERDGNFEVYSMNEDGSAQTDLTNNPALDQAPAWSPDGTKIAFVSDRTGKAFDFWRNGDVWVVAATAAAGGPLTKISDHDEPDTSPRWSPDGQTIAFLSPPEERAHPEIWLASSRGGERSRMAVDDLDLIPTALRWSGDGKALYFETGLKGTTQVFRVDLQTRKARPLTTTRGRSCGSMEPIIRR